MLKIEVKCVVNIFTIGVFGKNIYREDGKYFFQRRRGGREENYRKNDRPYGSDVVGVRITKK